MKNLNKWIATMLAAVMLLSIAAVAGADPVTIRFSWWGGNSRHEATEKAVAAFMQKNPDIVVECEYGAWDGWTEKCLPEGQPRAHLEGRLQGLHPLPQERCDD